MQILRNLKAVFVIAVLSIFVFSATAQDAEKVVTFALGPGDIPWLDPAQGSDTSSISVITEIFPSLTRLNEVTVEVEPGIAESWEVSEDGLTYTFTVRDNISWVNLNPDTGEIEQSLDADGNVRLVNAHDFAYGMSRSMDPRVASYYGGVLAKWVVGGEALNGALDDVAEDASDDDVASLVAAAAEGVQITVIDDFTIEISVTDNAAFVPNILGMWMAAAQPQWAIEEYGDLWQEPENIHTYGPFAVSEWLHEESLTMVRNPFWEGTEYIPVPALDAVQFVFLDASAAFANYEAGLLDVTSVPLSEMDRVQADADLSQQLYINNRDCTYYYGFNSTVAPMDDVRVRRAFSMAIDRQALIDNILKGGQAPAVFFSREEMLVGAPTAADYPELALEENDEVARALIEEYIAEVGDFPVVTLMHNESEAHATIAAAIQEMWRDTFDGLLDANDIQIQTQEWAVYLDTIDNVDAAPAVWRLGWCSDYPDAHNFLYDVFHSSISTYATGWTNDEFDALLDQAQVETDTAVRTELYAQAEGILTNQDAVIAPIYFYTTVSMTNPRVERTFSVTSAPNRFEKWDISQ